MRNGTHWRNWNACVRSLPERYVLVRFPRLFSLPGFVLTELQPACAMSGRQSGLDAGTCAPTLGRQWSGE